MIPWYALQGPVLILMFIQNQYYRLQDHRILELRWVADSPDTQGLVFEADNIDLDVRDAD